MVIDVSASAVLFFVAQVLVFVTACGVLGVLVYYKDNPEPYSNFRHGVYITLVSIAFLLIFGFVQINWLP